MLPDVLLCYLFSVQQTMSGIGHGPVQRLGGGGGDVIFFPPFWKETPRK